MVIAVQGNNNIINRLLVHSKQLSAKALPSSSTSSPFSLVQTIVIPNVNGRIDHMTLDIRGQKLFVTELENNSLDIIDLKAAKRILSISNNETLLNEPQFVFFIPELNRIFVSNGQDGTVDVFDVKSFRFIKKINFLLMMRIICAMMLTVDLFTLDTEKSRLALLIPQIIIL
jgi:DNA-binding beta-propeller fold protein YncE